MPMISPPKYVKTVLITLQSRGHLAYLVGGCVRDMLLGTHPHDWDVCTSALPEQVMDIFPGSIPTGIKHGTVTVRCMSKFVEVTTFRTEGTYADHRHPDAVSFVGNLNEDLSRRDFTVNAIALPPEGIVADPFGGVQDLERRLIRCVGEPEKRFEEDALRMFRALRFSAKLGFDIEKSTFDAIKKCAYLASSLAAERVREETEKILLTADADMIYTAVKLGLYDEYLLKKLPESAELPQMEKMPHKALSRFMLLCAVLKKYGCIASAEDFLLALRCDSRTVRCCSEAENILSKPLPQSVFEWKKLLSVCGVDSSVTAAECHDAMNGEKRIKQLKTVLKSGECFSIKHLAVTGDDLLELGYKGRELGEMLRFLLEYVMEFPENNRRELLLALSRHTEEN